MQHNYRAKFYICWVEFPFQVLLSSSLSSCVRSLQILPSFLNSLGRFSTACVGCFSLNRRENGGKQLIISVTLLWTVLDMNGFQHGPTCVQLSTTQKQPSSDTFCLLLNVLTCRQSMVRTDTCWVKMGTLNSRRTPHLLALSGPRLVCELDCEWFWPLEADSRGDGLANTKELRNLHTASRG